MQRRIPHTLAAAASCVVLLAVSCAGNELRLPRGIADAPARGATSTSAGPTPTTTGPNSTTTTAPSALGWRPEALRWSKCQQNQSFQCATLSVPLDWTDTAGTRIDLALARQPTSGKARGELLTNPGGPGASGLDFLFANPFDAAVTSAFDVVSWDPRGVGASTHLRCGSKVAPFLAHDPDPDDADEQRQLDASAKAVADECRGSDLALLAHIGTDDVARDLEAIRLALGDRPLNYVGFSYGTYVGLRYAELFPTHLRSMVLDGVIDPTQRLTDWLEGQTRSIDATLRRAFTSCTAASKCPVPDLDAAYDQVRARVERSPLPSDQGRSVGPAELATAAIFTTYQQSSWRALADAIASALGGDGSGLMSLAQGYYDFGGYTAYAGVECTDSTHPNGSDEYRQFAEHLEAISPRFGGSVANELLPCAYWPVAAQDHADPVRAAGSPPILVIGNRGDPATPYENSVKVAAELEKGNLVSYTGEGHTSYGRAACVTDAVDRYLIDLEVPATDPNCR